MKTRLAIVLASAIAVTAVVASGAFAQKQVTPVTVTVTMSEFKFRLSRTSVPKGTPIVFKVVNKGRSAHDFDFPSKGTPYVAPAKSFILKLTFSKAGTFRYVCTVPRHVELGMSGRLAVK